MLKSIATYFLAAAALVAAVPVEDALLQAREIDARATTTQSGNANFDRISAQSNPVFPIGYYGGLTWTGIYAIDASNRTSGLQAVSSPNAATYSGVTDGLPIVSSLFTGSRVNSFSVSSLYFGCETTAVKPVAVGCKVGVYGFDKDRAVTAYSAFYFKPAANNSTRKLSLATLDSTFTNLSYLRFVTTYTGAVAGSTVLDNVKYSINVNSTVTNTLVVV